MSDNPYQPPKGSDPAGTDPMKLAPQVGKQLGASAGTQYTYESTAVLTHIVSALLLISALCTLVIGGLDVAGYFQVPGLTSDPFDPEFAPVDYAYLIAGLGGLSVYLLCGIMFLIWVNRSVKNAHALRPGEVEITPGWAVGYWFIPILNLFRPYQGISEVYRASAGGNRVGAAAHWKSTSVPGFFPAWWFCWVVGNVVSRIQSRADLNDVDFGEATLPLILSANVLELAGAVLCVLVIRSIYNAQEESISGTSTGSADPLPSFAFNQA